MKQKFNFEKAINKLLNEQAISVATLAQKSTLTPGSIYLILNGTTINPRIDTLKKLALGFEIDLIEFFILAKAKQKGRPKKGNPEIHKMLEKLEKLIFPD
jgi:predicted transcriptional regulator